MSSFHHQAIDRLGDGLAVVATSPDGVPEAIELPGRPVLAVQWELQEEWRIDRAVSRRLGVVRGGGAQLAPERARLGPRALLLGVVERERCDRRADRAVAERHIDPLRRR